MIAVKYAISRWCFVWIGVLLSSLVFLILFPLSAQAHTVHTTHTASAAHAVLLRSDPAQDERLHVAPDQVRLWFSEALNPTFSTVTVENATSQQRVDTNDAQLSANNISELEVTLEPQLPPALYVVLWRSDSNDDGHIETGSFLFTVLRPDGSLPPEQGNTFSTPQGITTAPASAFTTIFSFLMTTLLEGGAVFWIGAQLWLLFVVPTAITGPDDAAEAEEAYNQQIRQRFERRFALPSLFVLLLANTGVLLGQALSVSGSHWTNALTLSTLVGLIVSGTFGLFWLLRELLLVLALRLALYPLQPRSSSPRIRRFLQWVNVTLGLTLMTTMALSSHAAAVNSPLVVLAVFADWFHVLAAVLWIGGMLSLATLSLPVLAHQPPAVQARLLLSTLATYTPLAVAGVVLMALTGPFSATVQLAGWQQMVTTLYGQILLVKIVLVGLLLLTSASHVFWLRPRLKRTYLKYIATQGRMQHHQVSALLVRSARCALSERQTKRFAHLLQIREQHLVQQTQRLTSMLRWESVLGISVLLCVGLMSIFAGTLAPGTTGGQSQTVPSGSPHTLHATMETFDHAFTVTLALTHNQVGANQFTVALVDAQTHRAATDVTVRLNTEMPDMDMGIGLLMLSNDGNGHFHGNGDLAMAGQWQIIVQISTPNDPDHFHEAYTVFSTP